MSYHLRQASTKDIPFMIHLEKVVFAQFPEVMEHWDEQHQKEHYEHCFRPKYVSIIESEDHPIGAISIISRRKDISIVYLYLLPEFQEKDVDFSLVLSCRAFSRRRAIPALRHEHGRRRR